MNNLKKIRGVKCLIRDELGRFLLVKISYAHKKWTLPGGGVEEDESFSQAAIRELREETGIELANLQLFGEYEGTQPVKHPVQCFFGRTGPVEAVAGSSEVEEIAWFSPKDLPANRSDRVDSILELFIASRLSKVTI